MSKKANFYIRSPSSGARRLQKDGEFQRMIVLRCLALKGFRDRSDYEFSFSILKFLHRFICVGVEGCNA